jgi:gluconokinase
MGASGAGKTVIGRALAELLGWAFLDADDRHPPANVAKMEAGEPLTDSDRWPWLDVVGSELAATDGVVVACSALKRRYRDRLRSHAPDVFFACLSAAEPELARRIQARKNHYMPVSLLRSQLAALEPLAADENGVTVMSDKNVDETVSAIVDALANDEASSDPRAVRVARAATDPQWDGRGRLGP